MNIASGHKALPSSIRSNKGFSPMEQSESSMKDIFGQIDQRLKRLDDDIKNIYRIIDQINKSISEINVSLAICRNRRLECQEIFDKRYEKPVEVDNKIASAIDSSIEKVLKSSPIWIWDENDIRNKLLQTLKTIKKEEAETFLTKTGIAKNVLYIFIALAGLFPYIAGAVYLFGR